MAWSASPLFARTSPRMWWTSGRSRPSWTARLQSASAGARSPLPAWTQPRQAWARGDRLVPPPRRRGRLAPRLPRRGTQVSRSREQGLELLGQAGGVGGSVRGVVLEAGAQQRQEGPRHALLAHPPEPRAAARRFP